LGADQVNNDSSVGDDFSALMQRAAQGDVDAQERLCRQYEPKVRIVARVLLGPALRTHFDSLDLVQSVHRSLLVGMRNQKYDVSSPDKLIALATTIVRRKVARKWRRARRQVRIDGRESNADGLAHTLSSISGTESDPAQVAAFNDQLERLCANLSDAEKRMLELRLEGFTSAEVARELGLHPVAIRVRWTRLRQRLEAAGVLTDWI
jgi:RNA polymerase sigma-70 factor (ECF subfamily)